MSALSDLFTDIATEIRGKTGETGTIKPAEFPDKIAGIETGGGGSVSPGLYWQQSNVVKPYDQPHSYFMYMNEVYLLTRTVDSTQAGTRNRYIYKVESDGSLTEAVLSTSLVVEMPISKSICEVKGLAHIMGGSQTAYHFVFDGSTLTRMADLPGSSNDYCYCSHNNELYASQHTNTNVYKWDSENDAWDVVCTLGSSYIGTKELCSVNGTMYGYNKGLYEFNGSNFVRCSSGYVFAGLPFNRPVYQGYLYSAYATTERQALLKRTPLRATSNEETETIGKAPISEGTFFVNGDKLHYYGPRNALLVDMVMNLVEDTGG